MIEEQFTEYAELESKAIESYIENIYSEKVPEPLSPTQEDLSFWNIAGIEAVLFTISGIGIAIYSSIRTGGLFYIMETLLLREFNLGDGLTNIFSSASMITSLLAFELYVLADGFSKGRENKNIKRSKVGLFSSLGIIVVAGVFSGMGFFPNMNELLKMIFYSIIAIGSAVAGGLVALSSGENIGFTFSKVEQVRKNLKEDHKKEYQSWKEAGIKSYSSSHYALGSKKSSEFFNNISTYEKNNNVKETQNENVQSENERLSKLEEKRFSNLSKVEQSYELIEKFFKDKNRLPSTREISELGYSIGTVSTARNKFIVNNGERLIKKNIISHEMYVKAKQAIEKPEPEKTE